jgi:cysteine desulfurase
MSVAAHKFNGPIGVGALVLRHDTPLRPLLWGGPHQSGLRPGTESVALAVGMHAALQGWIDDQPARAKKLAAFRDRLESGLQSGLAGRIVIHGAAAQRLPQTSCVAFLGIDRQALLMALDLAGVACSAGAACASGSSAPSHVLAAMGAGPEILNSSLRFSLGATTTPAEIDEALTRIVEACRRIRAATRPAESLAPRS